MIEQISHSRTLPAATKIGRIVESTVCAILMLTAFFYLNGGFGLDRYPVSPISNADPSYRPHIQWY